MKPSESSFCVWHLITDNEAGFRWHLSYSACLCFCFFPLPSLFLSITLNEPVVCCVMHLSVTLKRQEKHTEWRRITQKSLGWKDLCHSKWKRISLSLSLSLSISHSLFLLFSLPRTSHNFSLIGCNKRANWLVKLTSDSIEQIFCPCREFNLTSGQFYDQIAHQIHIHIDVWFIELMKSAFYELYACDRCWPHLFCTQEQLLPVCLVYCVHDKKQPDPSSTAMQSAILLATRQQGNWWLSGQWNECTLTSELPDSLVYLCVCASVPWSWTKRQSSQSTHTHTHTQTKLHPGKVLHSILTSFVVCEFTFYNAKSCYHTWSNCTLFFPSNLTFLLPLQ